MLSDVDAVALLDFAHDEGALDGCYVFDVAQLIEDKLLVLLHIARTYF